MKKAFFIILILFVSLFYRFSAFKTPVSFWVDEFATVAQAKLVQKHGLKLFSQKTDQIEHHNIITHTLVALSFNLFGESEQTAKLPFFILGSLVPVLVFILTKKFTENNLTALSAGLLTALSYWQITWSLQARSYVLQQVIILLTLIIYFKLIKSKNNLNLMILFLLIVLGILTHTTYLLVLISLIISSSLSNWELTKNILKKPITYLFLIIFFIIGLKTGTFISIINTLKNGLVNNIWYYHSFLWRQYSLITFLGFLGLTLMWLKDKHKTNIIWLTTISFLIFVCFLFAPYVSRYILAIFPLLLIGVSISLEKIGLLINKKQQFLGLIFSLLIIVNGDKFVSKPQAYYSVNHDMREIAILNYNQVYQIILQQLEKYPNEIAVIDPWVPRSMWYLKTNCSNCYWFRWINEAGLTNGMGRKTDFLINENNEKFIPKSGNPPIRFIGELSDLKLAMSKYPKGFIWIDDSSLPADIVNYAKENFKKELYLESYLPEILENPYSIWPGTLYSWGF